MVAGALALAPAFAFGDAGQVYGSATNATCDSTVARVTGATANLFAFHLNSGAGVNGPNGPTDIIYSFKNNTIRRGAPNLGAPAGFWFLTPSNFVPAAGATDLVYVLVASNSGTNAQDAAYKSVLSMDHYVTTVAKGNSAELLQGLAFLGNATAGRSAAGATFTGYDLRFKPASEFDAVGSVPGVGGSPVKCYTGSSATANYGNRIIAGYNLYRIESTVTATPEHFLGGPDGMFSTRADNGWVAFIPLNPATGVDVDAGTDGNATGDLFGVQTGNLIFSDALKLPNGTAVPAGIAPDPTKSYIYAFQPVVKTGVPLANFNSANPGRVTDADGDTRMDSVDLPDATGVYDGTADLIDPSGTGLGLAYQGATTGTIILLSNPATASPTPLAIDGEVQFTGSFQTGVFHLNFTSPSESNIAGYNVYRSVQANDASSFVQVNKNMIVAKGSVLASYAFQDSVPATRRVASGVYYYKVEAIYLDGNKKVFGPFEVSFSGATGGRGR